LHNHIAQMIKVYDKIHLRKRYEMIKK